VKIYLAGPLFTSPERDGQGWSQASPRVKGIIERYDLFGWSLAH